MEGKGSLSVTGGGMKRKSSCPFGDGYYSRLSRLLLSEDEGAVQELKDCVKMVTSAKLAPSDEFWDSGDEMVPDAMKIGTQKKTQPDRMRIMKLDNVPEKKRAISSAAEMKAGKVEEPKSLLKDREVSVERLTDDEDDKLCSVCGLPAASSNPVVTCEGCSTSYHARCHEPVVDSKQMADDYFVFICSNCDSTSRASSSRSASPKPGISRSSDEKTKGASKTTTDLSATFAAYKKKKERQMIRAGTLSKK